MHFGDIENPAHISLKYNYPYIVASNNSGRSSSMLHCQICGGKFKVITNTHLSSHGWNIRKYAQHFGSRGCGFILSVGRLPKSDVRYKRWRQSLRKRPPPWNKGYTKETHPSVLKISKTFKKKKIDNFQKWRIKTIRNSKSINPAKFTPSTKLAFLIGLVLGDGNISIFPRTERLTISLNTKYPSLVFYTQSLLKEFFKKAPTIHKQGNGIRLWIYQKHISKRLGIASGNKNQTTIRIPRWILQSNDYQISFLKGLFEAEGSLSIHHPTYTYNFQFANRNPSLLRCVGTLLKKLGLHPEHRLNAVRLRRRSEVEKFKNLIEFRQYS
jgi:DNA-binding transcriptional regulator WhiA